MINMLKELGYQAKLALSQSARDQHEAALEEATIKRILAKAIANDPKNGAILGGKACGDTIITTKRYVEEDDVGLIFDPTKAPVVVNEEATDEKVAQIEEYVLQQSIDAALEKEPSEPHISEISGLDNGIDPWKNLSWIENNR